MVVISKTPLLAFAEKYPDAKDALMKWYHQTQAANWRNFNDLKRTFSSADAVANDRYIFNLRGNHYRLIALIIFKVRTVFILFIGTHKEYDKIDASRIQFNK
jgi:mRNA interferase HigB